MKNTTTTQMGTLGRVNAVTVREMFGKNPKQLGVNQTMVQRATTMLKNLTLSKMLYALGAFAFIVGGFLYDGLIIAIGAGLVGAGVAVEDREEV